MSRSQQDHFREDLNKFLDEIDRGEICVCPVIQWIQENGMRYITEEAAPEDPKVDDREDRVFARMWIYSHHIYNKFKRKDIIEWAGELKLTGFSLPGKPGIVCIEGYSQDVEDYWARIRRLNWKKLMMKEKEEFDIGPGGLDEHRKFVNFEEKSFAPHGNRSNHMDLGELLKYLEEHGCGQIFPLMFGIEGSQNK